MNHCTSSHNLFSLAFIMKDSHSLDTVPRHVAIIMDGNGRWARARGLPRIEGHRRGVKGVEKALKRARHHGVEVLTLFAFSVENWNRPKEEVDALMSMLQQFLRQQRKVLLDNKIRFRVLGRYEELSPAVQAQLQAVEAETADFTAHTLALALNYGSRTEISDAVQVIARRIKAGEIEPDAIDWKMIARHLYTHDLPDPDLIIRTSGESRLSNFLLLQSAYAEMYFSDVLWPDFDDSHFDAAISAYQCRERRYGKTTEQLTGSSL
jgi:undecaprenyl diphosphate synthase